MACANDRLYQRLAAEVFGRPDLLSDPRFATRKARWINRAQLRRIIADIFASDSMDAWIARMNAASVPVGRVRTVEQAFNAPEVRTRQRVCRLPHATAGTIPNIEPPIAMQLTPTVEPSAAPRLGEHTAAILRDRLGYSEQDIERSRRAGAFGQGEPASRV